MKLTTKAGTHFAKIQSASKRPLPWGQFSENPGVSSDEIGHARAAADYEALVELLLSPVNPLSCRKKDG